MGAHIERVGEVFWLTLGLLVALLVAAAIVWGAFSDENQSGKRGCTYSSGECGPSGPQPAPGQ